MEALEEYLEPLPSAATYQYDRMSKKTHLKDHYTKRKIEKVYNGAYA